MGSAVRWVLGAVLAGLAVTGCGADETREPAAAGAQDLTETAAPDPTSLPTATARPTPTAPPATVAGAARPLSSVLDSEPGPVGWHLPAGRWTTTAFAEPITFTTSVDLTVISESPGAVYLANPAEAGSANLLVLAAAAFVNSADNTSPQLPVPQDPEEITALIEDSPVTDLIDMGVVQRPDREVHWWEYTLRETVPANSQPCVLGARCLPMVITTGGEPLMGLVDQRVKLYDADLGDVALGAYVVGEQRGYESLVVIAEDIVSSLEVGPATPEPEQRFLRSLGVRQTAIPAGDYRVHLQTTAVDFAVAEDIETLALQGGWATTTMFGNASGLVTLLGASGYIDPKVDQAAFTVDGLPAATDYLADPPTTTEELDAWLRAVLTVTDTGEAELGGSSATWWDITLGADSSAVACGFPQAGQCIVIMTSDIFRWFVADTFDNRIYFFEDLNTLLYVEAFPGSTVEQLLDEAAPLLDSMTFVPVS